MRSPQETEVITPPQETKVSALCDCGKLLYTFVHCAIRKARQVAHPMQHADLTQEMHVEKRGGIGKHARCHAVGVFE